MLTMPKTTKLKRNNNLINKVGEFQYFECGNKNCTKPHYHKVYIQDVNEINIHNSKEAISITNPQSTINIIPISTLDAPIASSNEVPTSHETAKSIRNGDLIVKDNFIYRFNNKVGDVRYFKCKNEDCNARGNLKRGIFKVTKSHVHEPNSQNVDEILTHNYLKEAVINKPHDSLKRVYINVMDTHAVQEKPGTCPTFNSKKETLQRLRRKMSAPAPPISNISYPMLTFDVITNSVTTSYIPINSGNTDITNPSSTFNVIPISILDAPTTSSNDITNPLTINVIPISTMDTPITLVSEEVSTSHGTAKSLRNRDLIVKDNFIYRFNNKYGDVQYFKCKNEDCNARGNLKRGIFKVTKSHFHEPNIQDVDQIHNHNYPKKAIVNKSHESLKGIYTNVMDAHAVQEKSGTCPNLNLQE
ncbi:uncharacterized protein LOC135929407 isoform X1 [Gordionus sp. m RMFG-2023]|uniref:uncharacterized protein LOC135929407 isoform X1 n=1 Tax=Gordionus sp. m RMFG-2023 TaxID=3053472 RepID=UPI0031FDA513